MDVKAASRPSLKHPSYDHNCYQLEINERRVEGVSGQK